MDISSETVKELQEKKEHALKIFEQVEKLIETRVRHCKVVRFDGREEIIRPFKSSSGTIGVFYKRSRRKGYRLNPYGIKSVEPLIKKQRKTEEQKWIDAWNKVLHTLQQSGLWIDFQEDIKFALSIGYQKLKKAYDDYWNVCWSNQLDYFKEHYPELIRNNDGNEVVKSSILFHFAKNPVVKKMRFCRGERNNSILDEIQKAINEKRSHRYFERYNYDIQFEYNPENNKAFYSEEFKDCGNGHYYIALNATHALFMEDD